MISSLLADVESLNNKGNILEDASNISEMKSSPLTILNNDDVKFDIPSGGCTLLIPKRKQPPV